MKQSNITPSPLWRELNENRTQGEWISHNGNNVEYIDIDCLGQRMTSFCIVNEDGELNGEQYEEFNAEQKANAAYTALAVNNLASLAEALEGLLSSYRADFKTITGAELNDTEAVKKAKTALASIS